MAAQKDKNTPSAGAPPSLLSYLRDIRVIQGIAQIVFIILLVSVLSFVIVNVYNSLAERNLVPTFRFLLTRGGMPISDAPEWYSPNNTYGEAFLVGIINTIRAVSVGLVGATVIGILVGIFLLSNNWLIRNISRIYVEILRNTPLLVQLYFWYFVVFLEALPKEPTGIPAPGATSIAWAAPIMLLLIFGIWLYAKRTAFPARVTAGGLLGLLLLAVIRPLLMDSAPNDTATNVFIALVIGFFLLILFFAPRSWRGFATGFLIMSIGTLLGSAFFQLLAYFGVVSNGEYLTLGVYPVFYYSIKGLLAPEILPTAVFGIWAVFVAIGIALAVAIWMISGHVIETTGKPVPRGVYAFLSIVIFAVIGWGIAGMQARPGEIAIEDDEGVVELVPYNEALDSGDIELEDWPVYRPEPVIIAVPELNRFNNPEVGINLQPQYSALVIGLIIYTSAFIAEIVRAGIQAVPYGQLEAARALGLSYPQTLMRVILPQALRVIIPPLGNQYLNLSKNSSLAIAVAYADTYQVGQTMMNQSGQSITGFTLLLIVYLSLSLIISVGMNVVNSRFQLVTR
ncbi:ABC transporter permease subunit [Phototrophicus methaneseepsis]|uniref:ABC transporter permease subunit n=1 Tax=Phototrophicus methaneseepsis TaxID=2710758 RepID=A0A7S8E8W8_9CHLR|nr:ABC transporter permease subunit [Phototrophicus methaneseepsis]QPC82520.1 ABC transporter permease subunit [Phototrophicus methaneseepsis]